MTYLTRRGYTLFDDLERAATDMIVSHGGSSLSFRKLAAAAGISPSGLVHHYRTKQDLVAVVADRAAERRLKRIQWRMQTEGLLSFVPRTEEHLGDDIVVRALTEQGRSENELAAQSRQWREEERNYLDWVTGRGLTNAELDGLTALIEGVRIMMTQPVDPVSADRAAAALELVAKRVGVVAAYPPGFDLMTWAG